MRDTLLEPDHCSTSDPYLYDNALLQTVYISMLIYTPRYTTSLLHTSKASKLYKDIEGLTLKDSK